MVAGPASIPFLFISLAAAGLGLVIGLVLYLRQSQRILGQRIRLEQMGQRIRALEADSRRLREERDLARRELGVVREERVALDRELAGCQRRVRDQSELIDELRIRMETEFRRLAAQALEEQGTRLDRRHENSLRGLLEPVRDQMREFHQRVEAVYERESRDHAALLREIDLLRTLNLKLGSEAKRLSRTLRGDTRAQGQWGEMILENLLEDAGLRRGRDYQVQPAFRDRNGKLRRPDVVIELPDNRRVVVDAKVSLTHWSAACQEEDPKKRETLLTAHVRSLKNHIRELAGRQYHRLPGLDHLEFVLLFVPAEGGFQAALQHEPALLTQAMRKKIFLTGPVTLLAVLRIIHHLWRMDDQARNGLAIAKQAANLYDKFVVFAEAFEETGQRIDQCRASWNQARNRLISGRGSLISRIEGLRRLGVLPDREIPASLRSDRLETDHEE